MEPRFSCVLLSDGTHKSLRCLHHVLGVDVFYMSLGVILTCMTFLYENMYDGTYRFDMFMVLRYDMHDY